MHSKSKARFSALASVAFAISVAATPVAFAAPTPTPQVPARVTATPQVPDRQVVEEAGGLLILDPDVQSTIGAADLYNTVSANYHATSGKDKIGRASCRDRGYDEDGDDWG